MFGWDAPDLVGKQLKMLVKEGFESEYTKILEPSGNSSTQLISVRVTARAKDGSEFPVSITRLAWSSDTVTIAKSTAHYTWTAVFRDLSVVSSNTTFVPAAAGEPSGPAGASPALKELAEVKETHAMLRGANQALQRQLEAMSARLAASSEAVQKAERQRDELKAYLDTLERHTKES